MSKLSSFSSVRIAGTDYDRRRKVTEKMQGQMVKMKKIGLSNTSIGKAFDVTSYAVRTNTDPAFKKSELERLKTVPRQNVPQTALQVAERNAYKARLIKYKKDLKIWVK